MDKLQAKIGPMAVRERGRDVAVGGMMLAAEDSGRSSDVPWLGPERQLQHLLLPATNAPPPCYGQPEGIVTSGGFFTES